MVGVVRHGEPCACGRPAVLPAVPLQVLAGVVGVSLWSVVAGQSVAVPCVAVG